MDEVAALYATAFIGASPAGVMTAANDDQFRTVMARGYAHYRVVGTKTMRMGELSIVPMDEHHCIARVDWTATYAREDQAGAKTADLRRQLELASVQSMPRRPPCMGLVRAAGVEPALLSELDFESSASTNSTTPACADP
ncbi:MAG: hypothetical protein JWO33_404 [Caulobacteraceae bacterium]|nr:hypothetical protein [Caulobacteraceae bacterium]